MITHAIEWYESVDGEIFADWDECIAHEINALYKRSGVRFFIGEKEIENIIIDDDCTYNEITDIFIDRSKEKENNEFKEAVHYFLGWCLIEEAIDKSGEHYGFSDAWSVKEVKDD